MTNREKLTEVFPRTIFIYHKEDDKTNAIICTDEWLDSEYIEPQESKGTMAEINIEKMARNVAKKAIQELRDNGVFISRWIPVSERLPEYYKTVIASVDRGGVYPEARYSKECGWEWAYESGADYWEELDEVIAWMPLPPCYEPQESEDKE